MSVSQSHLSTGLPELDGLVKGLIPGDNIVWHVDSIAVYRRFAIPFAAAAVANGERVTYFRFASHPPLLDDGSGVTVHTLHPGGGFEAFVNSIHGVIEANGVGGFYLFDCLTELVDSWYSDEMLGNFFKLTCPYLLDIEALAYFGLLKQKHSLNALHPIQQTTQLFLDVFGRADDIFVHPVKVQQRYSPTMHMLHQWRDGAMVPVAQSGLTSEIYHSQPWAGESAAAKAFDLWTRTFLEADYLMRGRGREDAAVSRLFESLLHMVVTRDPRLLTMARTYLELPDVLAIGRRMIGTGLIGGKSVGMLLSQAILRKSDPAWNELLEMHDSFYIGSDVFYSYLVRNGCWWARQQRDLESSLHNARHARRLILTGQFPENMVTAFAEMLDYFGQAPIIVRSSSLLEDNFGNAFSGKYESVFCPNQGSRRKCLDDLLSAIRTIYASAMSEKAIRYRASCGMLEQDEQMSLLVQRVSGGLSGSFYYPLLAGVGYSYNPYVWGDYIDAAAGVLRLVFGLGTRAVDRADDDYTCLAALNDPLRRPDEHGGQGRYAQRKADVIDLEANRVVTVPSHEVLARTPDWMRAMVASEGDGGAGRLTFERLFRDTDFSQRMAAGLRALQEAYGCPVDIEFTANFTGPDIFRIGLVQCRPFQVKDSTFNRELTAEIASRPAILKSGGPVIGHGREMPIDTVLYVEPAAYGQLLTTDRYAVARLIGRVLNAPPLHGKRILLVGPGRWGTTTPALGVPVVFAEISPVSVLCEVVAMHSGLIPDVSLGTHFFNDLVERDMLYLAVYPDRPDVVLDLAFLRGCPTFSIGGLESDLERRRPVLRLIDAAAATGGRGLRLYANSLKQQAVCYIG